MTLTAMLAELYRRLNYATAPAAAVTTRLTAFLNETQQELASEPGLQSLLRGTTSLATVAPVPAATISTSSVANPTVITTAAPHGLTTGLVVIAGHVGSTPAINGTQIATVTGATTFTIPVNVTVGGTGGTVTTPVTATYALPPMVAAVRAITETTHKWKLQPESLDWYRRFVPDPSTFIGIPDRYVLLGPQAVSAQPVSTGSGVWAASTSAADTAGPTVAVRATRLGGYAHAPAAATALTGVTRVQIGAQTDYVEITDFELSVACAGDVTLYDAASGGNVLAVIPIGKTRSRYELIAFAPSPSAVWTYTIDYEKDTPDLVNNTDEPAWLPFRFHRLLVIGAKVREYEKTKDPSYTSSVAEWTRGLQKLLAVVNNPSDRVMVPRRPGGAGRSDLGAWYPAGTVWD